MFKKWLNRKNNTVEENLSDSAQGPSDNVNIETAQAETPQVNLDQDTFVANKGFDDETKEIWAAVVEADLKAAAQAKPSVNAEASGSSPLCDSTDAVIKDEPEVSEQVQDTVPSSPKKSAKLQKVSSVFKKVLGLESRDNGTVPIRVLIGYLPDVSERDVLEYSIGIAEKNFDQLAMIYYDAFPYDGGFVYEIHEGGTGKAFVPEILEYFEAQGEFDPLKPVTVVLSTATRKVEVQKNRQGLDSVLLPESSTAAISEFIVPKITLTPAFNQRTGFFVISAAFFIVSFFAMVVAATIGRYQPYEAPPAVTSVRLDQSELPSSQWRRIEESFNSNKIVKMLKYTTTGGVKKWDVITEDAPVVVDAPASAASMSNK